MSETVSSKIHGATALAIVEILIQPEYSHDWIENEVLGSVFAAGDITEQMIDEVETLIADRLNKLAASLLDELNEGQRDTYEYLRA